MKKILIMIAGVLLIISQESKASDPMNLTVNFNSKGSKPAYIRIDEAITYSDDFECKLIDTSEYQCQAHLNVIPLFNTVNLSIVSQVSGIELSVNSIRASYGKKSCELLGQQLFANKSEMGMKPLVYSELDLCP